MSGLDLEIPPQGARHIRRGSREGARGDSHGRLRIASHPETRTRVQGGCRRRAPHGPATYRRGPGATPEYDGLPSHPDVRRDGQADPKAAIIVP